MLDGLGSEARLALRGLARAPGFTAVAVLTLALGIGGTTAMFTAVNAAFLQSLPYPDEERLVALWQTRPESSQVRVSMLDALDWEAQSRSFEHLAVLNVGAVNLAAGSAGTEPRRATAGYVTRGFFAVLGVPPVQGRTFSAEEALSGGPRAAVIGHRLWQQMLGGDPGVLHRTLSLEGVELQVVGVMPPGFSYPDDAEIWLPLYTDDGSSRSAHNYRVIARLKRDVDPRTAQADLETVTARLAAAYPDSNAGLGVAVVPLRRDLLGRTGPVLLLLLGAVCLVFLIACANVVNLLLARSVARHGETTLRLALGASRGALLRPFLLESTLLALLGGAAGLGLALAGVRLLAGLAPVRVLPPESFRIDGTVLLFTLAAALGVGLACGAVPALRASRTELRTALQELGRGTAGGSRGMGALIVAEMALAFVLLAGAGLLIRSARKLDAVDPGFRSERVAVATFSLGALSGSRYAEEARRSRFFSQLLDRVQGMPGVRAAGVVSQPPLAAGSYSGSLEVQQEGREPAALPAQAHYRLVGGDPLAALGIAVQRGRAFTRDDRADAPKVALVNARLAGDLASYGEVLGLRVRIPGMDGVEEWASVVGVVADVHHRGVAREPVPEVYFPFVQRPRRTWLMALVAHTEDDPASFAARLRAAVDTLDPSLPFEPATMQGLLDDDLSQPRFRARLLGAFALTALALTATGIFGVVSYAAGRRTREVGIRMALGSDRRAVESLIVRNGMVPALCGIGIGAAVACALARLLSSLVFGVGVGDPVSFAAAALSLGAAALVATYVPARRAARVDPLQALRAD